MVRMALYSAAFVLVVLLTASAVAVESWGFYSVYTYTMEYELVDGLIYENDGTTLVKEGALVQFIVATNSDAIVDPLEYFDTEGGAGIDTAGELAAVQAWVNDGADPADLDADNVLCSDAASGFTGELELTDDGYLFFYDDTPPTVDFGLGEDLIAMRVWNLTKEELEDWCTVPGQELWYWTDREMGTVPESIDEGWTVGMGAVPDGAHPLDYSWDLSVSIGEMVYLELVDQNKLDTYLGTCPVIPEPGTMLLIGGAALLLLVRKKK